MDQVKIGKFIAKCRKEHNLTQMQLAEKLGITDRAISKWENGKSLPDSALMLDLCSLLEITVNDLLNGEVVAMENYDKEMENKLIELVKEKEETDKKMLSLEVIIGVLSCVILFTPIFFAAYLPNLTALQIALLILAGFIPGIVGLAVSMRIEQTAGYYECQNCGHRYIPSLKSMYLAMHMGRTRFMECPECGKKTWQKKVISKKTK